MVNIVIDYLVIKDEKFDVNQICNFWEKEILEFPHFVFHWWLSSICSIDSTLQLNEHIPAMMHTNYAKFCPMVVLILDSRSTKNNITDVMVFQWYFMYGEEVVLSYWSTQKTFYLNKHQRIPKEKSQNDNLEKLAL